MSRITKSVGYVLIAVSLLSLSSLNSCKKDEDICYSCVKSQKAAGPTVIDFCDVESKAEVIKSDYESQGFVCSEK